MTMTPVADQHSLDTRTLNMTELCDLAVSGLEPMLDATSGIFCDIYSKAGGEMERKDISPRYTMMTVLGLYRFERAGGKAPWSAMERFETLIRELSWIRCAGDLGLLLWTCAELDPERLPELYYRTQAETALARFEDAAQGRTMEVAWFLTGASTCILAGYPDLPGLTNQIETARRILLRNAGPTGIYGHTSQSSWPVNYVRRRIGSFADQVYPSIAFARLSRALGDEEARHQAFLTANAMCQRQGEMGEWFWQYDNRTGSVISRYPVFSVHQHAMGPMMLFEVAEATGHDFREHIDRGLAWIYGRNELGRDMVDPALNLIWRCIYLGPAAAYVDAFLRFWNFRRGPVSPRSLKIRYECRPYELGWLLYAFAGR